MTRFAKIAAGTAAAATLAIGAAPAQAQYAPYDPYYDRNRGVDVGDIVRGVAIAGAAAAAVNVLGNAVRGGVYGGYGYPQTGYGYGYPQGGYGYPQGAYGYAQYGQQAAIQACAYQAQRYGRFQVIDVDRRGSRSYRVRGVIDQAYNRGYGYGYNQRRSFKCDARDDGRVTDFDTSRY